MGLEIAAESLNLAKFDSVIDGNIFSALESLASKVRSFGYPCKAFSKKSLKVFATLSAQKKEELLLRVNILLKILAAQETPEINSEDHPDKASVEKALDFYGLEFRDDFWKIVSKDEIIEIYNQDQIQVFRTMNFFRITGYSLLDMLVTEWFDLWDRSSVVLQTMMTLAQATLTSKEHIEMAQVDAPEHIIKEFYNCEEEEGFKERLSLAKFNSICPLYKKGLPIIKGFAITSVGKVLADGEASQAVSFI